MRAQTIAQVVAAEAGGKTREQRLSAMKDVYSAMYNRAVATKQTVDAVVQGRNQFSAYNKTMPAGTKNLVGLAEQAMAEVEKNGPTHKGTYYARSYATKNLPKGLSKVKKAVDDHVYYADPKNRAIITAVGAVRPTVDPTQIAQAPEAAPAAGGLASFFADPLGMQAQAAEQPAGLAAYAAPEAKGLLGPTGYDPAKNPERARVDAMFDPEVARAQSFYDRNKQFVKPGLTIADFTTRLSPNEEKSFRSWVQKNNVAFDPEQKTPQDYDMRGFYKGLITKDPHAITGIDPNDKKLHYTDYYKTPYHETFSAESKFATKDAPAWQGDQLVAKDGTVVFDDAAQKPAPAQKAKGLGALADESFDARFASQPTAAQFDARFGAPATAAPERFAPGLQAPAGPFSPEHYAEATAPSSARARAAFDAAAASFGAPGVSSQPDSLGATIGSMVGPAQTDAGPRMSPDGKTADPFGNYKQAGPLGTVQKAETERMPGAALAYAPEAAPALSAPKDIAAAPAPQGLAAYSGPTASLSPDMMAPQQFAGLLPDMAPEMSQAAYSKLSGALAPPEDPQVAEVAGPTIADPLGTYPDAPTPENTFPEAPPAPSEGLFGPASKRGLLGLALGGPIGGLLGYASGRIGGLGSLGNPSLGPASAGERFGVGSGLAGIQRGMYGDRGATGYSRSNPNTSVTSRGRNLGWDLSNQFGAVTHYDANGNIAGSTPANGWGGFLGGLFGGDSKKDKDKDRGKGLGGINGSGYSGNGLY